MAAEKSAQDMRKEPTLPREKILPKPDEVMAAQGAITRETLGTFSEGVDTRKVEPQRQTEETDTSGAKHTRSAAEPTGEPPRLETRPIVGWQKSVRGVTRTLVRKEMRTRVFAPVKPTSSSAAKEETPKRSLGSPPVDGGET